MVNVFARKCFHSKKITQFQYKMENSTFLLCCISAKMDLNVQSKPILFSQPFTCSSGNQDGAIALEKQVGKHGVLLSQHICKDLFLFFYCANTIKKIKKKHAHMNIFLGSDALHFMTSFRFKSLTDVTLMTQDRG